MAYISVVTSVFELLDAADQTDILIEKKPKSNVD